MKKTSGEIKAVFEKLCSHLEPNEKLAKQLREFRVAFMTKNPEHMAFFGGNLTGVQVVRFTPKDRDKFFSDICLVDEYELEEELCKTSEIKAEWKVSSDALNHMCMWLIHIYNTSELNEKVKHAAMMEIGLILYYRFLTSVLYRFFPYPADPALAEAVYAQMSNKYGIKQYGNWQTLLEVRVADLIDKNSIHYRTLLNYDNDKDIIYLINGSQGRIKDIMKNIASLFAQVKQKGTRVRTSTMLLEHDGDMILKDKTQGLQKYSQYMHSIITDQSSFIKYEIIDILEKIVPTAPPKLLEQVLIWCSNNYSYVNKDMVRVMIDKVILHSFSYLENNRTVYKASSDLPNLISRLKGSYSSSRSSDKLLLDIRETVEYVIKLTDVTKNNVVVAALRTALMLYIVIRAFTMSHYSKSG